VSAVLSNRHKERGFAGATVERIRKGIRELGYMPNMEGRRLRAHKAGVRRVYIGILTSFEAPLFLTSLALRGVQRMVDKRTSPTLKFYVSIELFHAGRLREMNDLFDSSRFHGVIVTNTLSEDDHFLAAAAPPFSVVLLGRRVPNYCCVLEEPTHAGNRAAELLIGAGRKRIALLCPALLTQTTAGRVESFCTAVQNLTGRQPLRVTSVDFSAAGGAAALQGLLHPNPVIDGLFVATDTLAVGAYQAIKQAGRSIPEDIAVVGIGDHEFSGLFDPPLTCVSPYNHAASEQALHLLMQLMDGSPVESREIFLDPRPMEKRASSGRSAPA
jgi:LacI family transcriptional regulator